MGKKLYITEKPSVAIEFAKALGVNAPRQDGYIEDADNIITWCVGHLVTMSYPDKYDEKYAKWEMETLPFIPAAYKYEVIANSAKQFNVVKSLLNRQDVATIYNCGDSAREGEYIQRLAMQESGWNKSADLRRVWIDSQTKEEILRGIKEAKPMSDYDDLSDSAYARAKEDWLVGMNFSRGLSIMYGRMLNNANGTTGKGQYKPIAVGRVMSCVLGMIVERERQIRNTEIVPFYKINADLDQDVSLAWKIVEGSKYFGSPLSYNDIGLLDQAQTNALVGELNGIGSMKIIGKDRSASKKQAPLLFNLAELQGTCTKLFHISPAETLEIAQTLYEKKLTTYPRTDARVLTKAVSKEIQKNISGLQAFAAVAPFAKEVLDNNWHTDLLNSNTKYIDDSKVSDHYAIIPTGSSEGFATINSLGPTERQVYELICRRFLSIYYPAAEYKKIAVTGKTGTETFTTSCQVLTNEGYLKVAGHGDDADEKEELYNTMESLPDTVPAEFSMTEGKSQPPKRYTTGSMILAMENAGQLIEDSELREQIKGSGIGTSATRAAVIEKLEKNDYITVNKKTQSIAPAKLGEFIYELLSMTIPTILNPMWTANWEKGLQQIADGVITEDNYMGKINNYVETCTNSIKSQDVSEQLKIAIEKLKNVYKDIQSTEAPASNGNAESKIKCPICGSDVISTPNSKGYFCTGYKNGCQFSIPKEWSGKKISEKMAMDFATSMQAITNPEGKRQLVSAPTGFMKFKSKKGSEFEAKIQLSYTEGDRFTQIVPTFKPKN